MADTQKDKNVGTALAIVEKQQDIVGNALVGASGTAVLAESTDSQSQILEQIRDIQIKTLRGISEVAEKLKEIFNLDKIKERRDRERKTELSKETGTLPAGSAGISVPNEDDGQQGEGAGGKLAALSAFMMGLPGVRTIKRLLAPIMAFFGKSGVLFKIFGRFGPLAGLTLAVGFLMRYMDDIVKALAPVLDALKSLFKELQPVFDAIMEVVDIIAKAAIISIGQSLRILIAGIEMTFRTFMASLEFVKEVLMSIVTLDFGRLQEAFSNLFLTFSEIGEKFILAIKTAIMDTINAVGQMFGVEDLLATIGEMWTNVKAKFLGGIDKIVGFIRSIGDFFSGIGDSIKTVVNNIIDSLPLPKFVKDKMKFETKATREADNRIDETGVKSKYVDDNITGMQRERMTGGGATMQEASAEFTGEKYGTAKITQSGTSGYESVSGIMTPEEFAEYNKLDTNGQMEYLRALDDKEQERREMIKKLHEDKLEFDKANQDYINKYKTAPDEMMSPDDQMLQDDKFQREAMIKASTISDLDNNNQSPVIINNNNSTVDNSKVSSNTAVNSGSLDTGIDPYHDRHAFSYT